MNQFFEIALENLSQDSVSVLKKPYVEFMGQRFYGTNIRNTYANSPSGRTLIKESLSDDYYNAVISVWGDTPTVDDPKESEET